MAAQALTRQDADFNFGHIEPRSMDRRVVKTNPTHNAVSLQDAEGLNQGRVGMGVEIIQDQFDTLGVRVQHIRQVAHGMGKISLGSAFGQQYVPLTGQGFDHDEQVTGATSSIFVILATGMLGPQGQTHSTIGQQLIAFLIEAHDRVQRVIRPGIQRQQMLHLTQKKRSDLGNTPALDLPRLQVVFLSASRTVSGEIPATMPSFSNCAAKSSSVQRACPCGGWLHATATRWACCCSFSFGSGLGLALSSRAACKPSSTKRLRVLRTLSSWIYSKSLISRSVLPSSLLSRMCARRITAALFCPLLTTANNFWRSFEVSLTTYALSMPSVYLTLKTHQVPVLASTAVIPSGVSCSTGFRCPINGRL